MSKKNAENTLNHFQQNYNIISLKTFIEKCKSGENSLPLKSIILTFDDGHIRNKELLPFVREKKIPIIIFLCAGIINTNRHFWYKECSPYYSLS